MKSVFRYQDYRVYIQDYFDEMKARKLLSWRIFAKQAGFASPSYLKLVCQGKANLSDTGIDQVASAMNLKSIERDFFKILVNLNQAKTEHDKQQYMLQMEKLVLSKKVKHFTDFASQYFGSWLNPVFRKIAPSITNTKPSEIAKQFILDVTADDVKATIQFLTKNKIISKKNNGRFKKVNVPLSTDNRDIKESLLVTLHKQVGQNALDSLDKTSFDERNFSELLLEVSDEGYNKVVDEIANFRRRIMEIAEKDKTKDRLYSLNFQLFPLTHKIDDGNTAKAKRITKGKK